MKRLKRYNSSSSTGSIRGLDSTRVIHEQYEMELVRVPRQKEQGNHRSRRKTKSLFASSQPSTLIFRLTTLLSAQVVAISTAAVASTTTRLSSSTSATSLLLKNTTGIITFDTNSTNDTTTANPAATAAASPQSNSQYFIEHYYADTETHISSYKFNEFYEKYRPEVGIRTALILGSMLLLIVLYILWKNRCRCFCSGEDSSKADEELTYWLNHVENRNKKERDIENWPQQLPAACADSKQATAAWVVQHRKLWSNLHNRPKIRQHQQQQQQQATANSTDGNQASDVVINSHPRLFKMNVKQSAQNVALLNRIMKPFRGGRRNNVPQLNASKKNSKLHFHQKNFTAYKNQPNRLVEELDTSTQLLINYARIDAIDATHHHSVNFNKLTGGLTFIHHLNSTTTNTNIPGGGFYANNQTAQTPTTPGGAGGFQYSAPAVGGMPSVPSMLNLKQQRGAPLKQKPSCNDTCGSSSQVLNELPGTISSNSGGKIDGDNNDSESGRLDMDVIKDVLNMSSGVGAGLLQDFVTSMVHKRRTSWPRCRADHLQFCYYTRDIRLFYNHHHGGGHSQGRQYNEQRAAAVNTSS
jgi:hypothetical protein